MLTRPRARKNFRYRSSELVPEQDFPEIVQEHRSKQRTWHYSRAAFSSVFATPEAQKTISARAPDCRSKVELLHAGEELHYNCPRFDNGTVILQRRHRHWCQHYKWYTSPNLEESGKASYQISGTGVGASFLYTVPSLNYEFLCWWGRKMWLKF